MVPMPRLLAPPIWRTGSMGRPLALPIADNVSRVRQPFTFTQLLGWLGSPPL